MASGMVALKKELRKKMTGILTAVEQKEIDEQSKAVTEKVLACPTFKSSKRISIFVSTAGEICTDDLIRNCFRLGKQVFLPQFEKGNKIMRMVHLPSVEDFETLSTTLWNIRQPSLERKWEDYYESGPIDVVLAPGVAFTKEGKRLGHGMGYYDRWLHDHETRFGKKPHTAALGLRQQIISDVPVSETDVIIDEIVVADS